MKTQMFTTRHHDAENNRYYERTVEGEICFTLFGYEYFVHQSDVMWTVSEVTTGFNAHFHKMDKQEAIDATKADIEARGEDVVKAAMKKATHMVNVYFKKAGGGS